MKTLVALLSTAAYCASGITLYTFCYALLMPLCGLVAEVVLLLFNLAVASFPPLKTGALGISTFALGASVAICLSVLAAIPIAASLVRFVLRAAPIRLRITRNEFLKKMAGGLGMAAYLQSGIDQSAYQFCWLEARPKAHCTFRSFALTRKPSV